MEIATAALNGMLACETYPHTSVTKSVCDDAAQAAVWYADALIAALKAESATTPPQE